MLIKTVVVEDKNIWRSGHMLLLSPARTTFEGPLKQVIVIDG